MFRPNFTITFLRNPKGTPPTTASFLVPLNMNKLDMRDYLYHAYDVKCLNVRSFIKQARVQQGKPDAVKPQISRWFRPKASKKMTVEMDKPFVWPAEPEDFSPWSRQTFWDAKEENRQYQESAGSMADTMFDKDDRKLLREQARALLDGKEQWKSGAIRS